MPLSVGIGFTEGGKPEKLEKEHSKHGRGQELYSHKFQVLQSTRGYTPVDPQMVIQVVTQEVTKVVTQVVTQVVAQVVTQDLTQEVTQVVTQLVTQVVTEVVIQVVTQVVTQIIVPAYNRLVRIGYLFFFHHYSLCSTM